MDAKNKMAAPLPTMVYHITHVDNLSAILDEGALRCCGDLLREGTDYVNIAHQNIQDRRGRTQVPCGPRGTLHDYVPFYFAPLSPMLCAIHHGRVEGYAGGQSDVIYLVSNAQLVARRDSKFVFTNGHGTMALTDFFDDLDKLDEVDWEVMRLQYWNDTPKDPDRKRRRNAEFLVHGSFPWTLVSDVVVMTNAIKARIEALLDGKAIDHRPDITVCRGWYY